MILTAEELSSLVELNTSRRTRCWACNPWATKFGPGRSRVPARCRQGRSPAGSRKGQTPVRAQAHSRSGLFEGVTKSASRVYAYDLVVTDRRGQTRRTRDAFSFLPTLGESDLFLFGKGDERRIYEKLGAQLRVIDGVPGTSFAVWAPNAQRVSVVGDFNQWDGRFHAMRLLGASGVWEIFIPGVGVGAHYKFEIRDAHGKITLNTDPCGFFFEVAPKNAAIVWDTRKFKWNDGPG